MKRYLSVTVSIIISVAMLSSFVSSESKGNENQIVTDILSANDVVFLKEHKIPSNEIAMLKKDEAQRVISRSKAYNLSETQVKALVDIELCGNRLDAANAKSVLSNTVEASTVIPNRYANITHQLKQADTVRQASYPHTDDDQYEYGRYSDSSDQSIAMKYQFDLMFRKVRCFI